MNEDSSSFLKKRTKKLLFKVSDSLPGVCAKSQTFLASFFPKRSLPFLTVCVGVYIALRTLWMVLTCWDPLPFGDQWSEIVTGRPITWAWLYSQHMEHRILVPRLIFLLDRWLAAETNRLNYAVDFAIPAGLALLVFRVSHGAGLRDRWARLWAAGICLSLLLWAGQYQNFVWGFQVQFFGVVLASAAVFAVLALRAESAWTLAWVVLLECVAAYTLASGVLAGFLAVPLAFVLGRSRRFTAALTVSALAVLASYLIGYHTPAMSSDPFGAWHHAGGIAIYVLVALGAPLANLVLMHAPFGIGFAACAAAGLLGAYGFCRLAWTMARERAALQPHQAMLMTLAAFVACMLLITAAGRYVKGMESALVSRYTTPAVTFWCCILLVLAARAARGGAGAASVMALALPLVLLMGLSEGGNVAIAQNWVALRRAAAPAFLANVADIDLFRTIYAVEPDGTLAGSAALQWEPALRAARTSVFAADWAGWLGTPLASHLTGTNANLCEGAMERLTQVQNVPVAGWRVVGWAAAMDGAPVRRIVLVDRRKIVVGFGVGGVDLPAIGLPGLAETAHARHAWIGNFTAANQHDITAVALIGAGPIGCPLRTPAAG